MSETSNTDLFDENLIYIEQAKTQSEVFEQVAAQLVAADAVKSDFLTHLVDREANYPTGIDMSPVNPELPNVAIPHTEGEFVNVRKVVPIRLETPIEFSNMIDPSQKFNVNFLFMILNNDPEGQANVLAQIMDFLTTTPKETLDQLFAATDKQTIYEILTTHFAKM